MAFKHTKIVYTEPFIKARIRIRSQTSGSGSDQKGPDPTGSGSATLTLPLNCFKTINSICTGKIGFLDKSTFPFPKLFVIKFI
jgi:hypothetical protein